MLGARHGQAQQLALLAGVADGAYELAPFRAMSGPGGRPFRVLPDDFPA